MVFTVVNVAYKSEATSAAINALFEDIRVHDHRADGTQGAPWAGSFVDFLSPGTPIEAGAGWQLNRVRVRSLLGGAAALFDIQATRTGATIAANASGNMPDSVVLSQLPSWCTPANPQFLNGGDGSYAYQAYVQNNGSVVIGAGSPGGIGTGTVQFINGLVLLG